MVKKKKPHSEIIDISKKLYSAEKYYRNSYIIAGIILLFMGAMVALSFYPQNIRVMDEEMDLSGNNEVLKSIQIDKKIFSFDIPVEGSMIIVPDDPNLEGMIFASIYFLETEDAVKYRYDDEMLKNISIAYGHNTDRISFDSKLKTDTGYSFFVITQRGSYLGNYATVDYDMKAYPFRPLLPIFIALGVIGSMVPFVYIHFITGKAKKLRKNLAKKKAKQKAERKRRLQRLLSMKAMKEKKRKGGNIEALSNDWEELEKVSEWDAWEVSEDDMEELVVRKMPVGGGRKGRYGARSAGREGWWSKGQHVKYEDEVERPIPESRHTSYRGRRYGMDGAMERKRKEKGKGRKRRARYDPSGDDSVDWYIEDPIEDDLEEEEEEEEEDDTSYKKRDAHKRSRSRRGRYGSSRRRKY